MSQQAQPQHRLITRSQRPVLCKPLLEYVRPQAAVTHHTSGGEAIAAMSVGAPPQAADSTAANAEVQADLMEPYAHMQR